MTLFPDGVTIGAVDETRDGKQAKGQETTVATAESVETEYLTPKEAAERKGVALATIYKAIERGNLPSYRVLGRVAVKASDVDAYTPGSYGDAQRATVRRGPGRPKATKADASEQAE